MEGTELKFWIETVVAAFTAAGAIAAAVSAIFAGVQIRRARLSTDFDSLQKFLAGASERERALLNATGDAKAFGYAMNDLLNFLETHAAAINSELVRGITREFISHKL